MLKYTYNKVPSSTKNLQFGSKGLFIFTHLAMRYNVISWMVDFKNDSIRAKLTNAVYSVTKWIQ